MNLNRLNKKELLIIIANMKKEQLIKFIQNKFGGDESSITKEEVKFNNTKVTKKINSAMPDNKIYRSLDVNEQFNQQFKNKQNNTLKLKKNIL
jgi:hypothetical protein